MEGLSQARSPQWHSVKYFRELLIQVLSSISTSGVLLMVFSFRLCFAEKYFFKGRSGIAFLYPPVLPKCVASSTADPVPSFTGSTGHLPAQSWWDAAGTVRMKMPPSWSLGI